MFLIGNLVTAFATFSRIPMPRIDYNERNTKYSLCFFPLVGAVVGALMLFVHFLCGLLAVGSVLRAALLLAVPVLVTGGIHLDGYCDTVDALSSFAPREKKLQILKDPNAGAFAVIYCGLWYLLYFGALTELDAAFYVILPGFVLSRSLSALAVVNFRSARENGMGAHEKKSASRTAVNVVMPVFIALSAALMIVISPICGAVGTAAAGFAFLYYRIKSYRTFGGFTGDIAGWFLQISELAVCLSVTAAERIMQL